MYKYRVKYQDISQDPANPCPVFSCIIKAEDKAIAEEIFFEDEDGDGGWEIVSIKKLKLVDRG